MAFRLAYQNATFIRTRSLGHKMPPFSDDPVMIPFNPTLEEVQLGGGLPFVPAPFDHDRPVIPTAEDYAPPVLDPSRFYTLRMYRYRPKRGGWKHISASEKGSSDGSEDGKNKVVPMSVRIITWNLNYMRTVWDDRTGGILRHLEKVVTSYEGNVQNNGYEGDACVVLLQEVAPAMLKFLLKDEWVQKKFSVVPVDPEKWPRSAFFGNVTLVSRDLEVLRAQILHFSFSANQRTGLLVYLRMSATGDVDDSQIICIANTHLESLEHGERMRPRQLEALAQMLKQEGIEGGVIAGDMNSIARSDRLLPRRLGLKDAWRRKDSDPEGFTWGYQSLEEDQKYPPGRLDKILYLPNRKYTVEEPQRVGVGLKVRTREGEEYWASDHYGLTAMLHVTG